MMVRLLLKGLGNVKSFFIILLVFFCLFILSLKISEPFWGPHEFNGVFYGIMAKNYVRYGLVETRGAQINNFSETPREKWELHVRHPATYPIVLAGWMKTFGSTEASERSLSIVASVIGVIGLVKLNWEVWKNFWAGVAVIPVLLTPLFLYYGSMPVFEPLLLPLVSWGLYSYWKRRNYNCDDVTPLLCGVAFLIDWPGFWLGLWLLIGEVASKRRVFFIKRLVMALLISGLVIVGHQWLLTGSVDSLVKALWDRSSLTREPFTYIEWIRVLLARTKAFWGWPLLVASLFGIFLCARENKKRVVLMGITLGIGLSHIVVFRTITWYHDYMLYHLIPFMSLSVGLVVTRIERCVVDIKNIGVIVFQAMTIVGLAVLTVMVTSDFRVALMSVKHHERCVEFGKKLKVSEQPLVFRGSREETSICQPFIGYYAEKEFDVEVME